MKISNKVPSNETPQPSNSNQETNTPKTPKPKNSSPGWSIKKKLLTALIAVVVLIIIIFIKSIVAPVEDTTTDTVKQEETTSTTDKDSDKEKTEVKTEEATQSNEEVAISHLEKSDSPVEDTGEAKETLQAGIDYLTSIGSESFNPDNSNELSLTSEDNAKLVQDFLVAGYKADVEQSNWFYSDSDNVYQFTFAMTKEGSPDVVFSGNYLFNSKQLSIVSMTDEQGAMDLLESK